MSTFNSPPKRICAIHDLSGLGRCSLTVIIPVLAHLGIQVCPIPTALLSTHTGGYTGFTFLDLTDEIKKIACHWKELECSFDAVYTGFLGSAKQIELVLDLCAYYKKKHGSFILADPVMGDNGVKYATYTDEMCALTSHLIKDADIITPNLTEACMLANVPYRDNFSKAELSDLLCCLGGLGAKRVVITGIKDKHTIGCVYLDKALNVQGEVYSPYIDIFYPGAGDIFASVLLGKMLNGVSFDQACKSCVDFIYEAVRFTKSLKTPQREGLAIEPLGHLLR